jgi:cytochrome c oxidase assembly protein subunit 15
MVGVVLRKRIDTQAIMHSPLTKPETSHRAIRLWLLMVALLMVATLVVGGATRLTESGLSIVEWKPVTGVVPPLDAAAWQAEFDKYKTIPQFRERNAGMSLSEFRTIYWWEWGHRLLARLVGAAFLLPFLWFLWRGEVERGLRTRLWTIFALGGALGAVGWWMVSSGLSERVSVSQYRLAFHLTLACAIFAMVLWTAQRLMPRERAKVPAGIRASAFALLALVLAQIYLGALVAGLRAGLLYNTWPLIDGTLVPEAAQLFYVKPWWRNFFENPLTVQFDHRMTAYALLLGALAHAAHVAAGVGKGPALLSALALLLAVAGQAAIGIAVLLGQAPLALALLHQAAAIVVLSAAVVHAEWLSRGGTAVRDLRPPVPDPGRR